MDTNVSAAKSNTLKVTTHIPEMRKRISLDLSHPQITDQSMAKATDINNIMSQYEKTGMLPQQNTKTPMFINCKDIPSYETSYNIIRSAKEAFSALPATIRKLMDNDPSKMESFIANPEHRDLCVKYGLFNKPEEPPKEIPKETPPPTE